MNFTCLIFIILESKLLLSQIIYVLKRITNFIEERELRRYKFKALLSQSSKAGTHTLVSVGLT